MYVSSQLGRYLRIPKDTTETREVRPSSRVQISGNFRQRTTTSSVPLCFRANFLLKSLKIHRESFPAKTKPSRTTHRLVLGRFSEVGC